MANRSWWLASLFIPGWSQLMLGRTSGIVWLGAAAYLWGRCAWHLFTGLWFHALACIALAAALHVACTVCAARLGKPKR